MQVGELSLGCDFGLLIHFPASGGKFAPVYQNALPVEVEVMKSAAGDSAETMHFKVTRRFA